MPAQAKNTFAGVSKSVGSFIGKIPLVKDGGVDEYLISVGDSVKESTKQQLDKTLEFFSRHKDCGLIPVAERIDTIDRISNRPVMMLYDDREIRFRELDENE